MKKLNCLMFVILCLNVCILLSGCSGRKTGEQPVTVRYHADDGEYKAYSQSTTVKEDVESARQKGKKIIRMVDDTVYGYESNYRMAVNSFNNISDEFFIDLETLTFGFGMGDLEEGTIRINAEIASGGGPDIMTTDIFNITPDMQFENYLVDITLYLEESGITLDNYYPAYASITKDDRVYGIAPGISGESISVDKRVLGGDEIPELEGLLDKLLEYPEKAAFEFNEESGKLILKYFLQNSESLFGIIDWDKRKCDFSAPVFAKALDVAKRYSEDGKKGYAPIIYFRDLGSSFGEKTATESVIIGYYFDDGNHPKYESSFNTLVINANTENLDGAYAFISYILSEGGQSYVDCPTNRHCWKKYSELAIEMSETGRSSITTYNSEVEEQVMALLDDARYSPRKISPVLDIIYEEAEDYFDGRKTRDEVIDIIQNRVTLYLEE